MAVSGSNSMNAGDMQKQMLDMQKMEMNFKLWSMQNSNVQDECKTVMSARQGESSAVDTACQTMQRGVRTS